MSVWETVEEIDENGKGLTEWETNFLNDLLKRRANGVENLSPKQESVVQKIFSQRCETSSGDSKMKEPPQDDEIPF